MFAGELSAHVLAVPTNPRVACRMPTGETNEITAPAACWWANLLNNRYQLLLLKLWLALAQPRGANDDSAWARQPLLDSALYIEMASLRLAATKLVTLPRQPDSGKGEVAGAPFALPDEPLPSTISGTQARLRELLQQAQQLLAESTTIALTPEESDFWQGVGSADLELLASLT